MNYKVFEKYRIKRKLSKQEIARKLGKTPGWYSKLISGQMSLRPEYFAKMSEVLGVNPKKLAAEYFSDLELEETSSDDKKTA